MALADTAELVIALNLRGDASRGLTNLDRQLRGMRGGLSQVGRGLGQVGAGLDSIATRGAIAAAAGLGAVVTTAASFESAFAGVAKTVDATESELGQLEEQFQALAREMPVAFEELAAIGEAGGALGIAKEDLIAFTEVVAQLAATTNLTASDAATSLGVLGNVLGLTGEDFDNFGAALVDLGNKGASTESAIVAIAERTGAAGDLIGLSADEVLGFGAAVANLGIEAEAGGSSLQKFFLETLQNIQKDDTLAVMAATAGQTGTAFKEAFEDDAAGALEDFIGGLGKLEEAEQLAVLAALGFNDVRITRTLLGLAGDTENLGASLNIAAEGWEKNTALTEEFAKRQDTVSAQWQVLKNNARDALNTIGVDLLPVASDAMKEFVAFLQEPGTQQGLKDFARDLASGVKDLVREVKGADFGPLIDTMKGAASIAKGAFDTFRSLPQPIQQLAIAALVANKVTGGAVGQIAGGLGSILGGVIKIGFQRGSSPANPLFVTAVGGGLGGGPGVVGGAGRLGGLGRILGGGFAVLAAAALAEEFEDEISGFAGDLHDSFLKDNPLAGLNLSDLEWPFGNKNAPDWARLDPEPAGNPFQVGGPGGGGRPAPTAADGSFDRFGAKLDTLATNEVIEHLARTTEIGLKDVGTSFQVGLTTGLDPVGDIATRILARAEDPKAPAVMNEIQGHLAGLEEIQATYLQTGDVTLAAKVQANIDTLNTLIGKTDSHRAVTQYLADQAVSSDAAMLATAARTAAAAERTANKPNPVFDPKITVQNFVSVSATVLQQKLVSLRTTVGGGGFI